MRGNKKKMRAEKRTMQLKYEKESHSNGNKNQNCRKLTILTIEAEKQWKVQIPVDLKNAEKSPLYGDIVEK